MSWLALALVTISAVLHAGWNYIAKRASDSVFFLWGVCGAVPIISALVSLGAWLFFDIPLDLSAWRLAILGGFFQALYVGFISAGYNEGDLSIVYPLARGLAPLIIAVLAWVALHEVPTVVGIIGMVLVLVGATTLAADLQGDDDAAKSPAGPGVRLALAAAAMIAVYHVIDKAGAKSSNVVSYLLMMQIVLFAFLTPFIFWRSRVAEAVSALKRDIGSVFVAAVFLYAAYALVVAAMMFEEVAYIAAARNISIIFGIILGVVGLKEGRPAVRIIAGVLITAGIVTLAVGG
ncbi:MAG: EamA family transporter [Armatimonadota bacterium]